MRKSFRLNSLIGGGNSETSGGAKSKRNSNFEAQLNVVARDTYSGSLYDITGQGNNNFPPSKPGKFIANLSSNAGKLLRNVYKTHNTAVTASTKSTTVTGGSRRFNLSDQHHHHHQNDAIGSLTSGSFRAITSNDSQQQQQQHHQEHQHYSYKPQTYQRKKKTEAELEIETRLKRSKRRVLPSAKYEAPNSELACQGLNLDELEEIKQDNLRQTLTRSQSQYAAPSLSPVDHFFKSKEATSESSCRETGEMVERKDDKLISSSFSSTGFDSTKQVHPLDELLCSCKNLISDYQADELDDLELDRYLADARDQEQEQQYQDNQSQQQQTFCSCASISSSLSSIDQYGCYFGDANDDLTAKQTSNQIEKVTCDGRVTVVSLAAAAAKVATTAKLNDADHAEGGTESNESRASGGRLRRQVKSKLSSSLPRVEHFGRKVGDRKDSPEFDEQQRQVRRVVGVGCGKNVEREPQVITEAASVDRERLIFASKDVELAPKKQQQEGTTTTSSSARQQQQLKHKQPQQSEQQQVVFVRNLHKVSGCKSVSPASGSGTLNGNNSLGGVTSTQMASLQVSSQVSNSNVSDDDECQVIAIAQRQPVTVPASSNSKHHQQVACSTSPSASSQRVTEATSGGGSGSSGQLVSGRAGGGRGVTNSHTKIPTRVQNRPKQQVVSVGQLEVESKLGIGFDLDKKLVQNQGDERNQEKRQEIQSNGKTLQKYNSRSGEKQTEVNDHEENDQDYDDDENVNNKFQSFYEIQQENSGNNKWLRRQRRREEIMMSLSQVDLSNFWQPQLANAGQQHNGTKMVYDHQYNTNLRLHNTKSHVAMNERSIDCARLQQVKQVQPPVAPTGATTTEHLYASVCGSQTPSPDADHYSVASHYHINKQQKSSSHYSHIGDSELGGYWQQQPQQHFDGERARIFDRQLSVLGRQHQDQQYKQQAPDAISMTGQSQYGGVKQQKKSLLKRLKHFIASGNQKIQSPPEVVPTVSAPFHNSAAAAASAKAQIQSDINSQKLRWQKSRTLTSKSTQNLLNSSMRLLSTSRKSMNLIGLTQSTSDSCDSNPRKSLVSGFLTLGRKSTKKEPIVQQLFTSKHNDDYDDHKLSSDQHHYNHQNQNDNDNHNYNKLTRIRRVFGSADSLPSGDSELSCNNLHQTTSSSTSETEQYCSALRMSTTCGNLYTLGSSSSSSGCCVTGGSQLDETTTGDGSTLSTSVGARNGYQIVGRAVAKVDCNPCAYDKEALVFKQGDLIDILERNESGTWIGQCNGRIGHFKFINVTEITTSQFKTNTACLDNNFEENNDNSKLTSCGYVTKLEIKSNNNSELELDVEDQEKECCKNAIITKRPLSLSMSTIANTSGGLSNQTQELHQSEQKQQQQRLRERQQKAQSSKRMDGKLSGSSETIMSSLEQLLYAIGLAGEQVNLTSQSGHSIGTNSEANSSVKGGNKLIDLREKGEREDGEGDSCDHVTVGEPTLLNSENNHNYNHAEKRGEEEEQAKDDSNNTCHLNGNLASQQQSVSLSYLEALSKSGINNLDSFGNLHQLEELEQIGILDDEHRRRLLMAARIIRQASRAARMDFVGDYRTKSSITGSDEQMKGEEEKRDDEMSVAEKTTTTLNGKPNESKGSARVRASSGFGQEQRVEVEAEHEQSRGENDNNLLPLTTKSDNNVNEPIYVNLLELVSCQLSREQDEIEIKSDDEDKSARTNVQKVSGLPSHEPIKRIDLTTSATIPKSTSRPKSQPSNRHFLQELQAEQHLNSISGRHNGEYNYRSASPQATASEVRDRVRGGSVTHDRLDVDSINRLDSVAHRLRERQARSNFRSTSCCRVAVGQQQQEQHSSSHYNKREIDDQSEWWDGSSDDQDDDQEQGQDLSDDERATEGGVDVVKTNVNITNINTSSPLVRGYSMRASVRNSLGGSALKSRQMTAASGAVAQDHQVPPVRRSLMSVGRRAFRGHQFQHQHHQESPVTSSRSFVNSNRHRQLPPPPSPSVAQFACRNQHNNDSDIRQQPRGSQASISTKNNMSRSKCTSNNSTSAYDLRLDLSHFFS